MAFEIIKVPDPILKKKCRPIKKKEFNTEELRF